MLTMHSKSFPKQILNCVLLLLATAATVSAQATDTFRATTANMDPTGESLKFDVLRWSSDDERQAVVDVLTAASDQAGDSELSELTELPTLGYLWTAGSGIGYALKYAHRVVAPGGEEAITFVTDRRLGTYSRAPWTASDSSDDVKPFTVVELRLDANGDGDGKMSVGAEIALDAASRTVTLANYDAAPVLLADAKRQSPPYRGAGSQ